MQRRVLCLILLICLAGCGGDEAAGAPDAAQLARGSALPTPTEPVEARPPTPTFVPTAPAEGTVAIASTEAPAPPVEDRTAPTTAPQTRGATTIRLEDTAWTGSWRNRGESVYGGRTATWIYGAGTSWSTMQATFDLPAAVSGTAHLAIEGMDDEWDTKTEIEISVNDTSIYSGPNPLPNDDQPLDQGTWATHRFPFDAALLGAGSNTITIVARTPGTFGQPPFFMLDYAEIVTGGV